MSHWDFIRCLIILVLCDYGLGTPIHAYNKCCRNTGWKIVCICDEFNEDEGIFVQECEKNHDCSSNEACIHNRCTDPCVDGTCGIGAVCRVKNHVPVCACPEETHGNPFTRCYEKIKHYDEFLTLKYSENKPVYFDCKEYLDSDKEVHIGWRNLTSEITIFDAKQLVLKYTATDNGSILFCHLIKGDMKNGKSTLYNERFEKYTRLILEDEVDPASDPAHKSSNYTFVVIATVVSGTVVMILLISVIIYKRCHNKSVVKECATVDKNNFYLNLLFREECQKEIEALEPEYAEIPA